MSTPRPNEAETRHAFLRHVEDCTAIRPGVIYQSNRGPTALLIDKVELSWAEFVALADYALSGLASRS